MPTPPSNRTTPPPDEPGHTDILMAIGVLLLLVGLLVLLIASGHGIVAFVIAMVIAGLGLAAYIGADR